MAFAYEHITEADYAITYARLESAFTAFDSFPTTKEGIILIRFPQDTQ
jgi:hypothetical protein